MTYPAVIKARELTLAPQLLPASLVRRLLKPAHQPPAMDIALDFFDEYVGDKLYSCLENPLAKLASPAAANASSSSLSLSSLDLSSAPNAVSSVTAYLATVPGLSSLPRDSMLRQALSLYAITYVGIFVLYFSVATASYYLIFDKRMEKHPRFLKNQVAKEIAFSLEAFPMLDLLTLPWFVGDVRGHSQLYDSIAEGPFGQQGGVMPWLYMAFSAALFLWFTDFAIYWVHRWLHIPFLYKRLHKPHHKWISASLSSRSLLSHPVDMHSRAHAYPPAVPTPFASHAFHPVDGYLQSVPYHMACYMFPIHKYMFIGLFSFVNLWSIFVRFSRSSTGRCCRTDAFPHHPRAHRSTTRTCCAVTRSSTTSTDRRTTLSTTSTSRATTASTLPGPTRPFRPSASPPRATTRSWPSSPASTRRSAPRRNPSSRPR